MGNCGLGMRGFEVGRAESVMENGSAVEAL